MLALYLNALWLISSLILVTAPAATTALFASVCRWREDGETPTARTFFRTMRQTWRPSSAVGLVLASGCAFAVCDVAVIGQMGSQRWIALAGLAVVAEVGALCTVFVFVVMGRTGDIDALSAFRTAVRSTVAMPVKAFIAAGVVVVGMLAVQIAPATLLCIGVAVAAGLDRLAGGEVTRSATK